MTMPKTLAALPSNQYATLLLLVFGQLLDWLLLFAAACATAGAPSCTGFVLALLLKG
jgi:hypothetical protein